MLRPSKLTLAIDDLYTHLIRSCLGQSDSTSQTASWSVQHVPTLYNGCPFSLKITRSHGVIWTPSNVWLLGSIGAENQNVISIASAVFAGLTSVTDRHWFSSKCEVSNDSFSVTRFFGCFPDCWSKFPWHLVIPWHFPDSCQIPGISRVSIQMVITLWTLTTGLNERFCHQYLEWIDVTVQNPLQQVNALTFTEAYGVDNEGNKDAFCFATEQRTYELSNVQKYYDHKDLWKRHGWLVGV